MNVVVRPKQSAKFFVFIALILSLVSVVGQGYKYFFSSERFSRLVELFNVGAENNIPSLYSTFILLLCAALLMLIALVKQQGNDRLTAHWWGLSIFFLYLTFDEALDVHEPFMRHLAKVGLLNSFNIGFLLFAVLAYAKFFWRFPFKIQRLLFLSGSLFILGVMGIEQIGERVFASIYHQPTFMAELITTVEELLEMVGVTIFLYALLWYISSVLEGIHVSIGKPLARMPEELAQPNGEVSANEYLT